MSRPSISRLVTTRFLLIAASMSLIERLEAADRFWINSAGGSFGTPGVASSNWSATDGGAGGATVPTTTDVANFTLNNTYEVDLFANVTNTDLDVENGNVSFDLHGFTYTATFASAVDVGNVAGQTGRLTIMDGTLGVDIGGRDVSIGAQHGATGFLTVSTGGVLGSIAARPDLFVGEGGTGTLTVQSDGALDIRFLRVGDISGSTGTATITGPQALVDTTNETIVGDAGTGTMTVSAGAEFTSASSTKLGNSAGSGGTITVTGAGSHWTQTDSFDVGFGGVGTLNVQSGGVLTTLSGTIGNQPGGFGTATVTGSNSTWSMTSSLITGTFGEGALTVSSGGHVSTATNASIGSSAGSNGNVTITGATSRLDAGGFFLVGTAGAGSLTIAAGAIATSASGRIATFNAAGTGEVTITDAGSSWISAGNVDVGTVGTGTLTVRNGGNLTITSGTLNFGDSAGAPVGTLNFDGGTISATNFTRAAGVVLNWTDGTLSIVGGAFDNGGAAFTLNGADTDDRPTLRLTTSSTILTQIGALTVGNNHGAALEVTGDSFLQVPSLTIGAADGGDGSVIVSGTGSEILATTINVGSSAGGKGTVTVGGGADFFASTTLNLFPGSVINLNGGQVKVLNFNASGGTVNFSSGEFHFTGSTTLANAQLDAILGAGHILGAGRIISAVTSLSLSGPLTVNGGNVSAPQLTNDSALQVDAGVVNVPTLINNAGRLIIVSGTGSLIGAMTNNGTIELEDNLIATSGGTLTNNGVVRGSGFVGNSLSNAASGQVQVTTGNRLEFTAGGSNSGLISLNGGEIQFNAALANVASTGLISGRDAIFRANGGITNNGSIAFSNGTMDVFGDITSTRLVSASDRSHITVSGGGLANFYDDVTVTPGQTDIQVSSIAGIVSRVVFFGSYNGGATGSGIVFIEGDHRPGNSPAWVNFGGDVLYGGLAKLDIELAGATPGTQYDRVTVVHSLSLDGTLAVSLTGGFMPTVGQSFDILDWGSLTGVFAAIQLPTLSSTLAWNTSRLYTSGVIAVAPTLLGDYNANGVVDAADYVVWRKTFGSTTDFAADGNNNGGIDPGDLDAWRANFGQTLGIGSGASAHAAVPEPSTLVLLIFAAAGRCLPRRSAA